MAAQNPQMNYAYGNLREAVSHMATSPTELWERVRIAMAICQFGSEKFDADLQARWQKIHDLLTEQGSFDATLRAMPPDHVKAVADEIVSLTWAVTDRIYEK